MGRTVEGDIPLLAAASRGDTGELISYRGCYTCVMARGGLRRIIATASDGLLAGILALVVAACTTGGVTTYRSEAAGNPSLQLYAPYAAMNGSNLTIIRNNPFPGDPAGLATINVMNVNNPMQKYRFAPAPQPDWNGYTVIVVFGETPVGNQSLCQNVNLPPRPTPAGQTAVVADLCYGPQLITEVWGHAPMVAGPDDPQYAALIGGVLEDLFALRQPHFPHGPRDHDFFF